MRDALSQDETTAMSRYVAGTRRQLQEAAELFCSRYGSESEIARAAARALMAAIELERQVLALDDSPYDVDESASPHGSNSSSAIVD